MIWLGKVKISNSILGTLLVYDKLLMQGASDHAPYVCYLAWQTFSVALLPFYASTGEGGEQSDFPASKIGYTVLVGEVFFLLWIVQQCKKIDHEWWFRCIRLGAAQKLQACHAPSWMKAWLRIEVMGQDPLLLKKKRNILNKFSVPEESITDMALEGWYRGLCCRSLYLDKQIAVLSPYILAYADISDKLVMRSSIQDIGEKACYRARLPEVIELTGAAPVVNNKGESRQERNNNLLQISEQAFAHTTGLTCLHFRGYASGWLRTQSIWQANNLQSLTIQVKEVVSLERRAIAGCSHLRWVVIEGLGLKTHPHWEAVKDCPALEYLTIPRLINPEHVVKESFLGIPALKKLIMADEDYVNAAWRQTIFAGRNFTVMSHSTAAKQAYKSIANEAGIENNSQSLEKVVNKHDAVWDAVLNMPFPWIFHGRKEVLAASIQQAQKIPLFVMPVRWQRYIGVYHDALIGQGFFTRKESCCLHEALCLGKKSYAKTRLYPRCGDEHYASASVWDLLQRLPRKRVQGGGKK